MMHLVGLEAFTKLCSTLRTSCCTNLPYNANKGTFLYTIMIDDMLMSSWTQFLYFMSNKPINTEQRNLVSATRMENIKITSQYGRLRLPVQQYRNIHSACLNCFIALLEYNSFHCLTRNCIDKGSTTTCLVLLTWFGGLVEVVGKILESGIESHVVNPLPLRYAL